MKRNSQREGVPDSIPSAFEGLVGIDRQDVTPPIGIYSRNWGAAEHDVSEGVHHALTLTCVTFQSSKDETPLVLISADFGVWRNPEDGKKLRNRILSEFSISPEKLMFCLTHTHSGPVLSSDDSSKPGGEFIADYLDSLERLAIIAVRNALFSATSAVLTWNYGTCNLATNRDLFLEDSQKFVVGFNAKKKADNTLLVGRITNEHNEVVGTLVNYACHPTTLAWENRLTSPDYVGALREIVESQTDAPCLFIQGASGDLAPKEQYVNDPEIADKNGRQVGYAVLSTLENMLPPRIKLSLKGVVPSGANLALWEQQPFDISQDLEAEMHDVEYDLKSFPSLKDIIRQYEECENRILKEKLWRMRNIRINLGDGDRTVVPVWVWKIGDSLLVGQPNEAYSEFQETIRKQFDARAVAVINLVNGSAGYLPPSALYNNNIYSVIQTPFAAGSLEKLCKVALEATKGIINND